MRVETRVSRSTIATVVLAIVSMLLAIGLFFAGAMWRARVTGASLVSPEQELRPLLLISLQRR
jgi:hypothetical protein